jgi:two-component system LytT family response regulator
VDMIRVMVIDDEMPARMRLLQLLEKQADVEVAGVGEDGTDAIRLLQESSPDLLFLDVHMPGLDGFEVLRDVSLDQVPPTIFVTGYDAYAIRAFEARALDYLLKPFSDERFEAALQVARSYIRTRKVGDLRLQIAKLLEGEGAADGSQYLDRVVLKSSGRVIFLDVGDIDWIEAAGVYVNLHVGSKSYLHRSTIGQLQERLDPRRFVRLHRSTIVNTSRIVELQQRSHGNYAVIIKGGRELSLSRLYRPELEHWLRQSL